MSGIFALSRLLPLVLIAAVALGGFWLHVRAGRAEARAEAAESRAAVAEANRRVAENAMAELSSFMRRADAARIEAEALVDDLRKMEGSTDALSPFLAAAAGRLWPAPD